MVGSDIDRSRGSENGVAGRSFTGVKSGGEDGLEGPAESSSTIVGDDTSADERKVPRAGQGESTSLEEKRDSLSSDHREVCARGVY